MRYLMERQFSFTAEYTTKEMKALYDKHKQSNYPVLGKMTVNIPIASNVGFPGQQEMRQVIQKFLCDFNENQKEERFILSLRLKGVPKTNCIFVS